MGNCFGKSRARGGPKYEVIERHMEVDGKLFTEKEATKISMDASDKNYCRWRENNQKDSGWG